MIRGFCGGINVINIFHWKISKMVNQDLGSLRRDNSKIERTTI